MNSLHNINFKINKEFRTGNLAFWMCLCSFILLLAACKTNEGTDSIRSGDDSFDYLVTNARIIDGMGNPWFRADVGIRGDRIVEIGDL